MKTGSWIVILSFISLQMGIISAIYVTEIIFLREVEEILVSRLEEKSSTQEVAIKEIVEVSPESKNKEDVMVSEEKDEKGSIEKEEPLAEIAIALEDEKIVEEEKDRKRDIEKEEPLSEVVIALEDAKDKEREAREEEPASSEIAPFFEDDRGRAQDWDGASFFKDEKKMDEEEIIEVEIIKEENELVFPVVCENATFISGYGMRNDPKIEGKRVFHHGVDILADEGSDVVATDPGKVIYAGWKGKRGKTVILEAVEKLFYYTHLSLISVEVGDKVGKGQKIGEVGSTGRSTGPHLHYEIRVGGESIDPIKNGFISP